MSRLRAYSELVRLPNAFTAMADICLGWFVTMALGSAPPGLEFLLLLAASTCLYCSGIVWNDFFDVEQDQRERPGRPLPSGRVSRRAAAAFATGLCLVGLACAALAGAALLAGLLVLAILLYDAWLKRTWVGPLAMGSCRFLNVLLGLALLEGSRDPGLLRWHLALVVGLYIVGVTWFARTEARASSRAALAQAVVVMLAAWLLALAVPTWLPPDSSSPLFPYLLVALAFLIGLPISWALALPSPSRVQAAVKRAILGLVGLDAVLATAVSGNAGLLILVLLVPHRDDDRLPEFLLDSCQALGAILQVFLQLRGQRAAGDFQMI
jgi:4-hydroxybenzoate polyprenyltransferase